MMNAGNILIFRVLITILFFNGVSLPIIAGQQVGDITAQADKLWAAGQYVAAAEQFEHAERLRTDRPVLLYKAAEAYYRGRSYGKAADCYRLVREPADQFELAGLRYARTLKQSGRYAEAREAFLFCFQHYRGEQRDLVRKVIDNDIAGCDLAIRLDDAARLEPPRLECARLPEPVNTSANEFAPLLFSDDVLYFSVVQTPNVEARLWRSERLAEDWQAPAVAIGLPAEIAAGFVSGAFSPDGNRYYCTQCAEHQSVGPIDANSPRPFCRLLMLRRNETGWAAPVPLRDYINLPEYTILAPAVAQDA